MSHRLRDGHIPPIGRRLYVDCRGPVVENRHVGGDLRHEGTVKPLEVLPHQPPGKEIYWSQWFPGLRTHAISTLPPVALLCSPLEKTHSQAPRLDLIGVGVHRVLPAGGIEHQIVRIVLGEYAPAGTARLDNVQVDRGSRRQARLVYEALQGAQAPRPDPHYGDVNHATPSGACLSLLT